LSLKVYVYITFQRYKNIHKLQFTNGGKITFKDEREGALLGGRKQSLLKRAEHSSLKGYFA